jgi:hypothetical protein
MKVLLLILSLLIVACKATPPDKLEVAGLAFYNNTNNEIRNMSLKVAATGKMVSCNTVEPQSYCGTGFPTKYYQQTELLLSWQDHQQKQYNETVTITQPAPFLSHTAYIAVIKIDESGHFRCFFREKDNLYK